MCNCISWSHLLRVTCHILCKHSIKFQQIGLIWSGDRRFEINAKKSFAKKPTHTQNHDLPKMPDLKPFIKWGRMPLSTECLKKCWQVWIVSQIKRCEKFWGNFNTYGWLNFMHNFILCIHFLHWFLCKHLEYMNGHDLVKPPMTCIHNLGI